MDVDDWPARLHTAVEATLRERQRRAETRREFALARTHGLTRRHQIKLDRLREGTMPTTTTLTTDPPGRVIRCRYTYKSGDLCTGVAVDPYGEVILCTRHLAAALELIRRRIPK